MVTLVEDLRFQIDLIHVFTDVFFSNVDSDLGGPEGHS